MVETLELASPVPAYQEPEVVTTDTLEAQDLLSRIATADPLNADWERMRSNLSGFLMRDWEFESDNTVRQLLELRNFVNTQFLNRGRADVVISVADASQPIDIPTDLVMGTQGFDSWAGRAPRHLKDTKFKDGTSANIPSIKAIKHYASRTTPMPPIKEMDMFIQPDGQIFFSSTNDGEHRLASAILRGDPNIKTYSIRVRHLNHDVLNNLTRR
ncbi:MAG TPA: hypothetical protein VFB03_03275 [Candidatus Saccharimonadales bacterium]|nr:hypothetical protein [Candidatus Saccharimonadales bacterium]